MRHTLRLAKRRVLPRNFSCGGNIEPAVDLVCPRGQDRHVLQARVHADGLPAAQDLRAALAALERLRARDGLAAAAQVLGLAARSDGEEELAGGSLHRRWRSGAEGGARVEC